MAENRQRYLKTFRVARKDTFLIVLALVQFAINNWYWPGRYKLATEARFTLSPELSHMAIDVWHHLDENGCTIDIVCQKCGQKTYTKDMVYNTESEKPTPLFDILKEAGKHRC